MRNIVGVLLALLVLLTTAVIVPSPLTRANAAPVVNPTIVVNSAIDANDANAGDGVCETGAGNGVCTLRAAVSEANALAGDDVIELPAGIYVLTIGGANEDNNASGDLDLNSVITLTGAGADATIIDANQIDRALDLSSGVVINDVTITGGKAPDGAVGAGGGGILGSEFTLNNCVISYNESGRGTATTGNGGSGGGVSGGNVVINNSIIEHNITGGGGLDGDGGVGGGFSGSGNINQSIIRYNSTGDGGTTYGAGGDGGGIYAAGLVLNESVVYGNQTGHRTGYNGSGGLGAGIYVKSPNSYEVMLDAKNSLIRDNLNPYGEGGGIYSEGRTILKNMTISGNQAGSHGGGIKTYTAYGLDITNSAIVYNIANSDSTGAGDGGGIAVVGNTYFRGTIIAHNQALNGRLGPDCLSYNAASFVSEDYNLVFDTSTCAMSGATGNSFFGVSPQLGPLVNNGGATPTHAPDYDSIVIDQIPLGINGCGVGDLVRDQRGELRPADYTGTGCDIGPFEVQNGEVGNSRDDLALNTAVPITGTGVTVTPTQGVPDTFSVLRQIQTPNILTETGEIEVVWQINAEGNWDSLDMTLCYEPDDLGNAIEATLSAYRWDGSDWQPHPVISTTVNTTTHCVHVLGVTQLSPWSLAGEGTAVSPQLAIAQTNGITTTLFWDDHRANCVYDVYSNTLPFGGTDTLVADDLTVPIHELGEVTGTQFYVVEAATCSGVYTAVSNKVGQFEFAIIPGG